MPKREGAPVCGSLTPWHGERLDRDGMTSARESGCWCGAGSSTRPDHGSGGPRCRLSADVSIVVRTLPRATRRNLRAEGRDGDQPVPETFRVGSPRSTSPREPPPRSRARCSAPCRRPRVSGGNNGHSRSAGTIPCRRRHSPVSESARPPSLVDRIRAAPGHDICSNREEAPEVLGSCRRRPVLGCVSARLSPTRRLVDGTPRRGHFAGGRNSARVQPVTCNELPGENVVPARSVLGRRAAGNSLHLSNRDSCAMLDSAPISLTRAVREARRESSPSQAGPPWRC